MITLEEKERALVLTDSYIHGIFDMVSPLKANALYTELIMFRVKLEGDISLEKSVLEAEKKFKCGS